jgi:hypothetical protein
LKYFEAKRPAGEGVCSDNACPCPEVRIPRGTGYLYIPQELVDFRLDSRTEEEANRKVARLAEQDPHAQMAKQYGAKSFTKLFAPGTTNPILMCEQGARLRGIDLETASADARYWWKTGLVPLRATPLISDFAGTVSEKPNFEANLPGKEFRLPNMCCVCLGPVEEFDEIFASYFRVRLSIKIPYCKQCYSKLRPGFFGGTKNIGVKFGKIIPVTLLFRNETYYNMFLKMNY